MTTASPRKILVQAVKSVCPQSILNWREEQYYGRYGEIELHFLDILCDAERDSLDIGANDGCYVHFLRHHSRHVHAFEPIPWLAKNLRRKFADGVSIHPVALSDTAGAATLHIPVEDGTLILGCSTISDQAASFYRGSRDISVPTDRLDNVYSSDAGFIKIDVEGHEERVLDGAKETIALCRPTMLVEVVNRLSPGGIARVARFFRALDYCGAFIHHQRLRPVGEFDIATMQRDEDCPDLKGTLADRDRFNRYIYIYNFIFFPRERADELPRRLERRIGELGALYAA